MRTVLIVEDDHETRVALRETFESLGYCVFSTTNGRDALNVLPSLASPIVVLLDQNMPVMCGDDFLRAKVKDETIAAIPVLVMSAVCDRTLSLGTSGFFAKPLDLDSVVKKVDSFFAKGGPPDGSPLPGTAAYLADTAKNPPQFRACLPAERRTLLRYNCGALRFARYCF